MPSAELRVRLQPRASRESIGPERAGVVRVGVTAPPVDGKANRALCRLIAKRAGVARGRVAVIRGERARDKVVRVEGIDLPSLREALGLDRYSARE
jgi:uncharacterized protein